MNVSGILAHSNSDRSQTATDFYTRTSKRRTELGITFTRTVSHLGALTSSHFSVYGHGNATPQLLRKSIVRCICLSDG